jgi:soluble lytic murein transglycosylase-like protein
MRRDDDTRSARRAVLPALLIGAAAAGSSLADTAMLRNGRVLEVSGFRMEGERIVLAMEGGGEIALPPDHVVEIRRAPATPAPAPPPAAAEPAPAAAPASAPDGGLFVTAAAARIPGRGELRDLAARVARRHRVDVSLVHAVIEVESQYDPRAVSPRGALGLMQLMPQTAARFAVGDPLDPAENLEGGVRYLKELLERYSGQVRLALAAYNAGEEAVERFSGIPPYRETVNYVERVRRMMSR